MISKRISALSFGVSSLFLGGAVIPDVAWADGVAAPVTVADAGTARTPSKTDPHVEEVVVTAQHREQSAQDLGIALTTLSAEDLADLNVKTVNDLARVAPSVQVEPAFGSGEPNFRIRGLGFSDYAANNAPTVGVYIDGESFPLPLTTQGQIFDVDRVEILRGPQGTLYGRNTTGGAINIDTANPTSTPTAGGSFQIGRFADTLVNAYASGPVTDRLRLRLAATAEEGGSWQKNSVTGEKLGDKDRQAVRLKGDWDANDTLAIKVNLHGSRDHSDGLGARLLGPTPGSSVPYAPPASQNATAWDISPDFARLVGAGTRTHPFKDNGGIGGTVQIDQSLGAVKLTDLIAYESFDRKEFNDWDGTPGAYADEFFRTNARVFTNELRLASNQPASPLQWVGGVYYSKERLVDHFYSDFTDAYGFKTLTHYTQGTQTVAGFGQVEYALTQRLKVIGGLRYEIEDRKIDNFSVTGILPGGALLQAGNLGIPYSASTGLDKASGKIGLEYRVVDPVLLYATVSRGVKSGGFTAYNTFYPNLALTPFLPEKVLTYETGFKSDLIDKRLRLNASAYYNDYRDQQVQSSVIIDGTYTVGRFVNAPRSHTFGTEWELEARPFAGLRLTDGFSFSRGAYDRFQTYNTNLATGTAPNITAPVVDRKGQDEGFPKVTFNGSVSYDIALDGYSVTPRVDYSYRSKLTSPWGAAANVAPYWLFDASLTWKPDNGAWSVALFGQNIFDKKYDVTRNFFTTTYVAFPGEPATYGLRVSVSY
ncbi:MAG: TonB-dependent receptor [Telmatospirillum sp.]|nr:TonB-dependent receptor [Telmatospirillum sp.]